MNDNFCPIELAVIGPTFEDINHTPRNLIVKGVPHLANSVQKGFGDMVYSKEFKLLVYSNLLFVLHPKKARGKYQGIVDGTNSQPDQASSSS